jgi:IclR family KDG regulon transcriptional repressor
MSTVDKIVKILQAFLDHKEPISIVELSNSTGINANILYRVISPLRKEGYICRISKSNQYIIGPKFLEFNNLAKDMLSLDKAAHPYLAKLLGIIDESIQLATLDGDMAITALILHGTQRLRVVMGERAELPLYCTGVGKVFLAHMKDSKIENYLANQNIQKYTSNTVSNLAEFKKHLQGIKKEGVAVDHEEYLPGIVEIAAPVKNSKGQVVAAIGILLPSSRDTNEREAELITLLKRTASDVSTVVG